MVSLIELDGKRQPSSFRLSPRAEQRLTRLAQRLAVNRTQAVEDAIAHLLGTIERDLPTWRTIPGEPEQAEAE